MTADHMKLWGSVEKTPVAHTKAITGKPYKGTSPKPHYLVMKATETFGPCGIGWGFTFSERVEAGPGEDRLHIAHVKVWYKWNGERGEVEHIGQTMLSGVRSNGNPYTDEDAPKKSVTDGLIKALSMLGFAGDIFMGRYDDSKYVSDLRDEEKSANGEKSGKAQVSAAKQPRPESAMLKTAKEAAQLATTKSELRDWFTSQKDGLRAAMDEADYAELRRFVVDELAPKLPESNQEEAA
jgi:hypothetical protein